jgi:filamentous hemagglutinin family protein
MRPRTILRAISSLLALAAISARAAPPTSITLDGSFGHAAGVVNPTSTGLYRVTPSMGLSAGPNLFQSFGTFNVGTGDTVDFTANAGTQNVIARVTGGSASSIDGTIESDAPNFFLLNPAGVMFGANAQVNLTGAFTVSTANYAKLSDGTIFYADTQHPINDAGLTSAPISAFGFLTVAGQTPAPISFLGTQFTNAGGIHVIGGNLTLDQGARLLAPGGDLTLFSAASSGEVPFTLSSPGSGFASATTTSFGNITIQNQSTAAIDSAQGGGSIVIRGGKMVVDNSTISSANSGSNPGGAISVQANQLDVQSGGAITASTSAGGSAGNVTIQANALTIDNSGNTGVTDSGIYSQSLGGSTGNSGDISLDISSSLTLLDGGQISAAADGSGNEGNATVQAGSLAMQSTPNAFVPGIAGNNVTIDVSGVMSLDNYSIIANEGNIDLQAGSLDMSGIDSQIATGGGSTAIVDVSVRGSLNMTNGSIAAVSTGYADTHGGCGSVEVHAQNLTMNTTSGHVSGITAQDIAFDGTNETQAGNVTVTVDDTLSLLGFSQIESSVAAIRTSSTEPLGSGNAGRVSVTAKNLLIDGTGNTSVPSFSSITRTGIFSASLAAAPALEAGFVDNAGNVLVNVTGLLAITGKGEIGAETETAGLGGNVTIHAGDLYLSNGSVTAEAQASGNGGTISITTPGLDLTDGAKIAASSVSSNAGDILLNVENLKVTDGSAITASAGDDGGSITADIGNLFYLDDATVETSASGGPTTVGGNITIDPVLLVLDQGLISASDPDGSGGKINITADNYLNQSTPITATGGVSNGSVTITTPDLNLSGSLLPLPAVLVTDENRLKESCARSINHEYSSLIVVGRGGTESAPDELQPDFGINDISALSPAPASTR